MLNIFLNVIVTNLISYVLPEHIGPHITTPLDFFIDSTTPTQLYSYSRFNSILNSFATVFNPY